MRRLAVAFLAVILVLTSTSLIFNWATEPPQTLDPGFGSYVRVGDAAVHYQEWGAHGSPIVLVPGAFESSVAWSAVGPLLGRDHRVYALDMAWHGYTRDTGSLRLSAQVDLLDGFIRALSLNRPLVVGHSLGAAVAASVAISHPDDVSRVVFADGDALPIPVNVGFARVVMRTIVTGTPFVTTAIRIASRWPSLAESMIASLCADPCPGLTSDLAKAWVRPLGQQSDVDALRRWFGAESFGLTDAQIASITVPTEIIWGTRDTNGGSLSATITNLHHPPVHLLEGANHLSMLADPTGFARAVEWAVQGK